MSVKALLLGMPSETKVSHLVGRALVWIGLAAYGWKLGAATIQSNVVGKSLMHYINLPFHEAGHLFFYPFGSFMQSLGGSLMQVLIPCLCVAAFLFKTRDPFGASVGLWWVGENFLDMAPYINDARAMDLLLLGGVTGDQVEGYHDWHSILSDLGWLEHDHTLALASHRLGTVLMAVALLWGLAVLVLQVRGRLARSRPSSPA